MACCITAESLPSCPHSPLPDSQLAAGQRWQAAGRETCRHLEHHTGSPVEAVLGPGHPSPHLPTRPRRSINREVTLCDAVSQCRRSRAQTPAVVERMSVGSLCACGLRFLSSQTSAGHQLDACWASWCSKTGSKQRSRVKTVDGFQLSEEVNLWSAERKAAFYLLEEWRPWLSWWSEMQKSEDTLTMSSFASDLLTLILERYQVGEVALPLMMSGSVPISSTVGFSTHLLKKYDISGYFLEVNFPHYGTFNI